MASQRYWLILQRPMQDGREQPITNNKRKRNKRLSGPRCRVYKMVQKPKYSPSPDVVEHGSRSDWSKSQKNGRIVKKNIQAGLTPENRKCKEILWELLGNCSQTSVVVPSNSPPGFNDKICEKCLGALHRIKEREREFSNAASFHLE